MAFALLGSGSAGNAAVIAAGRTRVLLDCGFSARETERRLARAGLADAPLTAILITHEHRDHVGGAVACARRFRVPVYLTPGTRAALGREAQGLPEVREFHPHEAFAIGDLHIEPFPVPHDAREPAQFAFSDGATRLGFLTDVGVSTPHIERMLGGCDALVLECNHDRDMLRDGPYPAALKARIGGDHGHLENTAAAQLLARLDRSRLRHVVAAHLSQTNNTPAKARAALAAVLNCSPDCVAVADQDTGFGFFSLAPGAA
jgi:phosphoribosyl 1,2-cyclic phosphodiesterase